MAARRSSSGIDRSRRATGDQTGVPEGALVEEGTIVLGRQPGEGEPPPPEGGATSAKKSGSG